MSTSIWMLFIIISCIVGVSIWLVRKLLTKVKIWTPKRIGWFLAIYMAAGIIAMIVLTTSEQDVVILAEEELNVLQENEWSFREQLDRAAYSKLDEQYVKETLVYEMQGDTLTLDIQDQSLFYDIVIEINRDSEVKEVVVKYYETPYIHYGVDLSSYIQQPEIDLADDTFSLRLTATAEEIQYMQIEPTIQVANQRYHSFVGEGFERQSFGMRFLYLNVPADVHIINSSGIYIP
ncbi:hypothetical protein AAGS61_13580 [Lysinibacillus sp. KU-BSD001]|uniref:hypothetical protein n=1 Tax=Lysinibacillus sp. KU-BSD001 TaxID=3141328 RepID=UPI0036E3C50F